MRFTPLNSFFSLSFSASSSFFFKIKYEEEKDVGHLEEMFTLSSGCLFTIFFLLLLLISLPKDVIDAEEENGHASGFRLEKEKRVQSGIEYYATEAKVGES